jgi:cytoskeletal protein CcmA (bactofilin family)
MIRSIIGQSNNPPADKRPEPPTAPQSPAAHNPASPASSAMTPRPQSAMSSVSSSKNVLSSDVEIKGSIKFSHDLIIDGKIEGEVISDGNLTIGENAVVKGELKTRGVTIFGKVEGNVSVSDRCELKSNAILIGDISAGTLSIEEGATFMGQSSVGRKPDASKAAARPQA